MSQVLLERLFLTLVTLRGPVRVGMCDVSLMCQMMTRFTSVSTEAVTTLRVVTSEYGSTPILAHLLVSVFGHSRRYIWSHPREFWATLRCTEEYADHHEPARHVLRTSILKIIPPAQRNR